MTAYQIFDDPCTCTRLAWIYFDRWIHTSVMGVTTS